MPSRNLMFMQPISYMNVSGPPIHQVMKQHGLASQQILVIHDDIERDFGKVSVKFGGSAKYTSNTLSVLIYAAVTMGSDQ